MVLPTLSGTLAVRFETKAVAQKLKELGGTPQTYEVARGRRPPRSPPPKLGFAIAYAMHVLD